MDRDEAFPFWDHLFSAASQSIQVKVYDADDDQNPSSQVKVARTRTGIPSNRRPATFTPASSSTPSRPSTPNPTTANSLTPQLGLLTIAKREAAKRGLYSYFFPGPVLSPGVEETRIIDSSDSGADSIVQDTRHENRNKEDMVHTAAFSVEEVVASHLPSHRVKQKEQQVDKRGDKAKKRRKSKSKGKVKEDGSNVKKGHNEFSQSQAGTSPKLSAHVTRTDREPRNYTDADSPHRASDRRKRRKLDDN